MVLPAALAIVASHGKWACLMYSAHSVWRRPRLFRTWPPNDFWRAAKTKHIVEFDRVDSEGDPVQVAKRLRSIADDIKHMLPAHLAAAEEWEDRDALSLAAQSNVRFLENFAHSIDPAQLLRQERRYSAFALIESVCLSDMLRRARNLREIVRRALPLVLPAALAEVGIARLHVGGIPRTSTARRARTLFDVAYMLFMRDLLVPSPPPRRTPALTFFAWCDSSPMGGRNWLLSHMHILRVSDKDDMLQLLRAIKTLVDTSEKIEDNCIVDDDDIIDEGDENRLRDSRAQLSLFVLQGFDYHCIVPGTLGTKAATLEHKTSTLLHGLALECPSLCGVQGLISGMVSLTTDMGVELGIAEVTKSGFWTWFGRAVRPEQLQPDDGVSSDSDTADPDLDDGNHLFPNSMPVPGLLHILDNLLELAHTKLQ